MDREVLSALRRVTPRVFARSVATHWPNVRRHRTFRFGEPGTSKAWPATIQQPRVTARGALQISRFTPAHWFARRPLVRKQAPDLPGGRRALAQLFSGRGPNWQFTGV